MGAVVIVLLTGAMALVLIRAVRGPTIEDRILAANNFTSITVLWLATRGTATGDGNIIDIAMIYALTGFIATIAVLKYVERRDLGADPGRRRPPAARNER